MPVFALLLSRGSGGASAQMVTEKIPLGTLNLHKLCYYFTIAIELIAINVVDGAAAMMDAVGGRTRTSGGWLGEVTDNPGLKRRRGCCSPL